MTIQITTNPVSSSGALAFSELRSKLKETSSGSVSLGELYRNGTYVPNGSVNNSIPTSGTIAVSNFRGANVSVIANITNVEQNLNANTNIFGSDYTNALKKTINVNGYIISQNFNPEDTTMLQACKARIDFLKDGIKFTNDVKKSDAILLIKEYNMIYSVYVNHDLNKNTLYTNDNLSIIIHNSVYQLNTDIVIGIFIHI